MWILLLNLSAIDRKRNEGEKFGDLARSTAFNTHREAGGKHICIALQGVSRI